MTFPGEFVKTKLSDRIYKKGVYGDGSSSVELLSDIEIKSGLIKTKFSVKGPFIWSQANLDEEIRKGSSIIVNTENFQFRAFKVQGDDAFKGLPSVLIGTELKATNEDGYEELIRLFGKGGIMDYPKPVNLISYLLRAGTYFDKSAIILDFFCRPRTTAAAVLALNNEDGGARQFICVQLPEPSAEESAAFKAGYKSIAEIGKERVRRVIKKLNEEQETKLDLDKADKPDRGFKVLKLDKSIRAVVAEIEPKTPVEKVTEQLELHINHVDSKATPEDLLYEILLKAGFMPTEKVETKTIANKQDFLSPAVHCCSASKTQ